MEKLFAKIDAEPARQQAVSLNLGARVAEFFASLSPRTLAWSASAAALAILLQAGLIASIVIKDKSAGSYETASAPSTDPGVGAFTLIRFAPQATSDDITKFLEANKLSGRGRTDGRRALQGPCRGDRAAEGRARAHRQEAAGRQGRRLYRHDRVSGAQTPRSIKRVSTGAP